LGHDYRLSGDEVKPSYRQCLASNRAPADERTGMEEHKATGM